LGLFNKKKAATASPRAKGYSEAGASLFRRALKSFIAVSGSPNEDINWNNYTLRQRGRMLYMASPVAASAIKSMRTKGIGIGLQLKSTVNRKVLGLSKEQSDEWQKKTEAEFEMWCSRKENCDALGINNFGSLQQLALMSWLMSGDVFVLIKRYDTTPRNPYTVRLHVIEADRISTPTEHKAGVLHTLSTDGKNKNNGNEIYDGVEVDKNGMVVAYHIQNNYPNQVLSAETKWTRVEAYGKKTGLPNILHIMSSERPEQYRGVTYLAQVIEPLLQLRRYTESELMAALIQSFFTAWINTESDLTDMPMAEVGAGSVVGVPTSNPEGDDGISDDANEYEMGPGAVMHLGENEKVSFGQPTSPSSGFDQFFKTMCRQIGAALEIPHDVIMKEYNRSYSSSRASLLEMWEAVRMFRTWFIDDFPQAVYEIWLAEAVAIGRIKAPGFFVDPLLRDAWCEAQWIGPVQGQIDPAKEVRAAIMLADQGFKTREQLTYELGGGDWIENVEQMEYENKLLKDAGGGNFMTALQDDDGTDDGDDDK
jgi:lambda family phage portal protein